MALIRIEAGGYYRFGSTRGLRPVDVFVGRIDEPADLGGAADEPVLSMVVTSSRPGLPLLGFAAFYLSAVAEEGVAAIPAFDLKGVQFGANYRAWRDAWDAGEASIWQVSPAEAYREAIETMAASVRMIRRPN